ncbi:type I DNA topoisomerase [Candidatus Rhodoluna planktonica]|uniref:DNA topoisomerase 1 n=1 Tax=Candidatus Rhodoluna planktonica TaxID=535712 RepID=A0A1D9DY01_9MICO|nr:type I DNA topoisomerase [Candidatus Rhodoluna planktonica]AOY55681.1 DNA topoisomerase I [Candidatus Rhodoluna planktonica]
MANGQKLVIVESPAKAKTIAKYLGDEFTVLASIGHIRDLVDPKDLPADKKKGSLAKFSIDIENDFEPFYAISPGKSKTVTDLKKALSAADELYLATDEDREGEAIAWHLLQVLKPKVPVKRMVFHEITKEAIQEALQHTRSVDDNLVQAQETRRVVDRLYGYEISPVLWRKINRGLSAGRVQSPATRLVVERERERMAFVSSAYHDVEATFDSAVAGEPQFVAKLQTVGSKRIATGQSFDDRGQLTADVLQLSAADAQALAEAVTDSAAKIEVVSVESKPSTRRPAAPFTTSTLQQEASRKLRMSAKQTMDTAQQLYQEGHITYMRTDSPTLSSQAVNAARKQAAEMFGAELVAAAPRVYTGKSKNAQEAHEAIRPAGEVFKKPSELASILSGRSLDLYDLIWKRTIASQMEDAKVSTTTAKIKVSPVPMAESAEFTASGTVVTFRGFMAAYEESQDETRDDEKENESKLPNLQVGQKLTAVNVEAKDHQTSPPPRYTEASLVKALEEDGIGRPSTYAAILSTIINKGYVSKRGQALVPEWIAFTVTRFLEENFGNLVDYAFTAQMEEDLDLIAAGKLDRSEWLKGFYFGESEATGLRNTVENLGDSDPRAINSIRITDAITLRTGKYGPYLEVMVEPGSEGADENGRRIVNIPDGLAPDELNEQKAIELINAPIITDRVLGVDPNTGFDILFKDGRYGPYVTLDDPKAAKPKTASLFKTMSPETLTLEDAVKLLSLPRVIGQDPETGLDITAQNGKFGPYLSKGKDSRSLATEDEIFTLDLPQALEIFAQPKYGGRRTAATPLKEFGEDPASGLNVVAKTGQFGLYVTDGAVNATVPKDMNLEEMTGEEAFELLAIRREKLGLEPGQAPAKSGKAAKKPTTTRTVKRGATRKSK